MIIMSNENNKKINHLLMGIIIIILMMIIIGIFFWAFNMANNVRAWQPALEENVEVLEC